MVFIICLKGITGLSFKQFYIFIRSENKTKKRDNVNIIKSVTVYNSIL